MTRKASKRNPPGSTLTLLSTTARLNPFSSSSTSSSSYHPAHKDDVLPAYAARVRRRPSNCPQDCHPNIRFARRCGLETSCTVVRRRWNLCKCSGMNMTLTPFYGPDGWCYFLCCGGFRPRQLPQQRKSPCPKIGREEENILSDRKKRKKKQKKNIKLT